MTNHDNWYQFQNIDEVDTPALVVYPERVLENIKRLKKTVSAVNLLRPHVKTQKNIEASKLIISQGINKLKCATIAEAEMLGMCEAKDVLLAYQPLKAKFLRLLNVMEAYPKTKYSCLVDNVQTAQMISDLFRSSSFYASNKELKMPVCIDLNVGMNRTGIKPALAYNLYKEILNLPSLQFMAFHAYDGHNRDMDVVERAAHCDRDFKEAEQLRDQIEQEGYDFPLLIAGGSPTFAIHSTRRNVECSPGTFIFWDKGYHDALPEQDFLYAALVLSRVISLPDESKICIDLGHKSIASENELLKRAYFKPIGQNEEHMIIEVGKGHNYKIGDVLFALPIHICPTVALYDHATVIENGRASGNWKIIARDRKINY
jgi:D-serine deaminase-like pyridoxal phosphate-dependent protein